MFMLNEKEKRRCSDEDSEKEKKCVFRLCRLAQKDCLLSKLISCKSELRLHHQFFTQSVAQIPSSPHTNRQVDSVEQ